MALLNVRHLHKGYNDTVVLQDLDLSLEKDEVVVILGLFGSGKSSTVAKCSSRGCFPFSVYRCF